MLYGNCTIYSNTFRLTRNHILQRMTVSNFQLLTGVYDSGKMLANFERKIKCIIDNAKKRHSILTENTTETKKILRIKILIHEVLRMWSKG